ncbi:MAG: hypothetical protein JWQ18_802 [Conexibacter sp.]|nr:hypothetical protein [Conexibacter sp.]
MDFSHVFSLERWRSRFRSDAAVAEEERAAGRAADATADEVGVPARPVGFDGRPMHGEDVGNGQGTGDVGGPGWAGWGA